MPDFIKDAPELIMGLELHFNAFLVLTTCRLNGMGIGQIPWTAINDYCLAYDIEGEQRRDLTFLIRQMDDEYIKLVSAKSTGKKASK